MNEQQVAARNTQLHTLIETVEKIRVEKYPNVPANLLRQVLLRHSDAACTETDLVRDFERLVNNILERET